MQEVQAEFRQRSLQHFPLMSKPVCLASWLTLPPRYSFYSAQLQLHSPPVAYPALRRYIQFRQRRICRRCLVVRPVFNTDTNIALENNGVTFSYVSYVLIYFVSLCGLIINFVSLVLTIGLNSTLYHPTFVLDSLRMWGRIRVAGHGNDNDGICIPWGRAGRGQRA
jgi:hypothetical protein